MKIKTLKWSATKSIVAVLGLWLCLVGRAQAIQTFVDSSSQNLASASLSYSTAFPTNQAGYLSTVSLAFSAAPASAETIKVILDARVGANYDIELSRYATVAGTTTNVVFIFQGSIPISAGDQIKVTCTNVSVGPPTVYLAVTVDTVPHNGNGTQIFSNGALVVSSLQHRLLGPQHTDTTSAAVSRGDLITGQGATTTWTRLAVGAANKQLQSDGTDVIWSTWTEAAPTGDDYVAVADSTTATTWRLLPNCTDTVGQKLNYTQATNAFSCGTSVPSSGAGSGDITTVGSCLTADCGIEGGTDIFPFIYEGTADLNETTFSVTDPTADRAIVFPNLGGTVALSANDLSFFAATTSAQLAGVLSDETGSGLATFATSPTFTTDITTPLVKAPAALGLTPGAGSNVNVTLSTTGDFVVTTDDLYVDTSANRVGIQDSTPDATLDVEGATYIGEGGVGGLNVGIVGSNPGIAPAGNLFLGSTGTMRIRGASANNTLTYQWEGCNGGDLAACTVSTNGQGVLLEYLPYDSTAFVEAARISLLNDGNASAGAVPGQIVFYTVPAGSTTLTERMRIRATGGIGMGTSTLNTDSLLEVKGHITSEGTAPTVSACGTGPAIVGNDVAGKVTAGTGSVTTCTLTFATAFANAPHCIAEETTTATTTFSVTTTTTTLVVASLTAFTSEVFHYICIGQG